MNENTQYQPARIAGCKHERKALSRSPTTDYPPPTIICAGCGAELVTIEEVKRFIEVLAVGSRHE